MFLLDYIKSAAVRRADVSTVRLPLPVSNSPSIQKTVLGDVLNTPEKFKLIAYIDDGNGITINIRRKEDNDNAGTVRKRTQECSRVHKG